MPRGKNYVNNNKGVCLVANSKARASMILCEYGLGCTRADCIYRHDYGDAEDGTSNSRKDEICLPFLAGTCTFREEGCRKRHPKKEEKERLIAKYKRTRCRFGDECYTEGCLYLHPREVKAEEPCFIDPMMNFDAFPPLGSTNMNNKATTTTTTTTTTTPTSNHLVPKPVMNSAWKAAPLAPPPPQSRPTQTPTPSQQQYSVPYPDHLQQYQQQEEEQYQEEQQQEEQEEDHFQGSMIQHQSHPPPYASSMEMEQSGGGSWNPMYGVPAFYPPPHPYYDPMLEQQQLQQQQQQQQQHQYTTMEYYDVQFYPQEMSTHFNADAQEFIPGNYTK